MPISLAKKKAAPAASNSGGGGGDGKPGSSWGLVAAFLAAGAFVAEMYVPPQYTTLSFQVLAGLAGLLGAVGMLGAIKCLRAGPKASAALGLLLSVGALGAVAFGFTRPAVPTPVTAPPGSEPTPNVAATNAPPPTKAAVATGTPQPATPNVSAEENVTVSVKVERLLPVTTRTTLLRARAGELPKPEPEPEPEPKPVKVAANPKPVAAAAKSPAAPAPVVDPEFPELSALAPSIELPPPPTAAPAPRRYPNTFRGATLATFEEINFAARNFESVNNLDLGALLDVSGMKDAQVIAARYRQVGVWLQRQAAFQSTVESADAVYEKRLRQANTSEDRLLATLAKFRETRNELYADTLDQTTAARRVYTGAAGVLKVLGDHFDGWEFDVEAKKLLFENQEIAAEYQAAIEKVKQASAQLPGS